MISPINNLNIPPLKLSQLSFFEFDIIPDLFPNIILFHSTILMHVKIIFGVIQRVN